MRYLLVQPCIQSIYCHGFQMVLALSGVVSGYDGVFMFDKPGDLFPDESYIGMRQVRNTHISNRTHAHMI